MSFSYTEEEYLAASRLYIFQSPSSLIRLSIVLLLAAGFFLLLPLIFAPEFPLWATLSLTALVEASFLYSVLIKLPRQYFRGDPKFRDKYEMAFSDQGIEVKTDQIDSKLAWSLYTKVIESGGLYLLIYGKDVRTMTVIPKRVFQNRAQEIAFRNILARQIGSNSALRQIGGGESDEDKFDSSTFTPPDWR